MSGASAKRALVIGIDAYGRGIPSLSSAVRDAQAVAQQLALAHGYEVTLLRDEEATSAAIVASLTDAIAAQLADDSSFFFYYAGHGVAAADEEQPGPKGFLLAHDADVADQATWLGMESLRTVLDGLACRHLMLVLDCCYAGAFRWTSTRSVGVTKRPLFKSQYERYRDGIAWQVLTSASYDELADDAVPFTANRGVDADSHGHSPFAKALLEGLSGNAADTSRTGIRADGVITATELYQFIFEKVAVNDRQTPGIFPLRHDNKGEYVFLAPGVELDLEPDPPLDDANNPWLDLDAYSTTDHELFFGRKAATTELLARVEASRFVAVVGASGCGKSSLIRAGLLPALDPAVWTVVECGELTGDPDAQLRDAQARLAAAPAGRRRLLVIDQMDVLLLHFFRDERGPFLTGLRALIDADDGPTVLIALRSDSELRAEEEFGPRWAEARLPVPAFDGDDLRAIAIGPARAKAVFFEPAELVDRLVDEVAKMPGAAALLSIALADLYRQAQARRLATGTADRMISVDDVGATGGVVGTLLRRASELFDAADEQSQEAIRRLLLRLVDQKPEGLVRRRAGFDELISTTQPDAVLATTLGALTQARLLIVGGRDGRSYVEPAHDALVAVWDRQLGWLAQSGSQGVIRDASKVALDWDRDDGRSKRSKRLWNQDPRLAELQRRDRNNELSELEHEFVAASVRRRRRLARVRQAAIAALLVLTVAAIGAGVYARHQQSAAVLQAERAQRASSRSLASEARSTVAGDADLAALMALEALRVADTPEARGGLADVLSWPTHFVQRIDVHDTSIGMIAFSADGRHAATQDLAGEIRLWDVGEDRATPVGDAIPSRWAAQQLLVVDDDDLVSVVVVTDDGFMRRLDATGVIVEEVEPPGSFVSAAVSEDGSLFAGAEADGTVRVFTIDEDFHFTPGPTTKVSPDSVELLTFSPDGLALAWADPLGLALWRLADPGGPHFTDLGLVVSIAFSPDRRPDEAVVAAGVLDGGIYVVDRSDPDAVGVVSSAADQVEDLAFRPDDPATADLGVLPIGDGEVFTLTAARYNGDVDLYEFTWADVSEFSDLPSETLRAHGDAVWSIAVSWEGRIASGDSSGEIIWWRDVAVPSLGRIAESQMRRGAPVVDAAFTGQGWVVSLADDGTAWLMPREAAGAGDGHVSLDGEPGAVEVEAAGDVIAVQRVDRTVDLYTGDGTFVRSIATNASPISGSIIVSPSGERMATVSYAPSRVALWDLTTGQLSSEAALPDGFLPRHGLFADNGVAWIGGEDAEGVPEVLEIDTTTGDLLRTLQMSPGLNDFVGALAMSDDGRILAIGSDRRIVLWDTETLEELPRSELTGIRGAVTGLAFWNGSDTLISSDDAGDVRLWNVSDRRQIAQLQGPTSSVASLEVDVDSSSVLAPNAGGDLWAWSLDVAGWRDLACQLAGRNMTQAEWDLYGDEGTRVAHCPDFPAGEGEVRDADDGDS